MSHINRIVIISAISFLTLAGCSSTQQSTQSSPPASETAGTAQSTAASAGYQKLLSVVGNTRAAVSSGDFTKAQKEFSQFEDNWQQVEDGIKAKSSKSYNAIEDSLDRVTGELKGSQPNKEKVLADLQAMEKNINSVAKL